MSVCPSMIFSTILAVCSPWPCGPYCANRALLRHGNRIFFVVLVTDTGDAPYPRESNATYFRHHPVRTRIKPLMEKNHLNIG